MILPNKKARSVFFALSLIFALVLSYFFYSLLPVSGAGGVRVLTIRPGEGFSDVAGDLKKAGVIRSEQVFILYSLMAGKAERFKPGTYGLNTSWTSEKIAQALVEGEKEITVSIFEGMTLKEIDKRLSSVGVIKEGELLKENPSSLENFKKKYPFLKEASSLEGFLFPDTYRFYPNSEPLDVIAKFLDNFQSKTLTLFSNRDNILKFVTVASLIEKEVPNDGGRRQLVAGVLYKRLAAGMPLQIDATVIYAECGGEYIGCAALKKEDYGVESPYNTYLYKGLPPTPVANPGEEALRAAVSPEKSDYWFYLSDPKTKNTIFSKTLDEHNQNRVKYLGIKG